METDANDLNMNREDSRAADDAAVNDTTREQQAESAEDEATLSTRRALLQAGWALPVILAVGGIEESHAQVQFIRFTSPTFIRAN